jgi:Tfp pilus assembly protein PilN
VVIQLAKISDDYQAAQAEQQRLHKLQEDLKVAQGEAALLAYLDHPWPRSQILAKLHEPLPDSVRLTGIKLHHEAKPLSPDAPAALRAGRSRRADPRESDIDNNRPAAEQDLQALIETAEGRLDIVMLTGVTLNTTELHTYVAHLRTSGLFDKSELRSLEKSIAGADDGTQKFEIRLVVSPGYCHPGHLGPIAEKSVAERAPLNTNVVARSRP